MNVDQEEILEIPNPWFSQICMEYATMSLPVISSFTPVEGDSLRIEPGRDTIEIFQKYPIADPDSDNVADPDDIDPVPSEPEINTVVGNIKTTTAKKQGNQLKNWFFTWNNYSPESIEILLTCFKKICRQFVFQKEVGASGTPHLQGTISLWKKMRWSEFKLPEQIFWEKVRNVKAAFAYCQKDDTRDGTEIWRWPIKNTLKIINVLKPWQQTIVDATRLEPDDRTVNWVFDPIGNIGKTVFAKYMYAESDAIICTGGGVKDIACMIALLKDAGRDLNAKTTFIFNLARTTEGISYKGIEAVKDGLMTSQKYESSTLVFNCPHVWVLSNQEPEIRRLSADRWKIWSIVDDQLVPFGQKAEPIMTEMEREYIAMLSDV